jgi:UDP-2-acetamido-3-amino-2,3-dideoxy-glucuronate N-acetyltransferase
MEAGVRAAGDAVRARRSIRSIRSLELPADLGVEGVEVVALSAHRDHRGLLSAVEFEGTLPFAPRRIFAVLDVPAGEARGAHAHREMHQVLVCLRGRCRLRVDDGRAAEELVLDDPERGVHLGPLVWAEQRGFTRGAVLLVLASAPYDDAEYIRDPGEFRRLVAARAASL